jgi:hypothetical protein
MPRATSRWKTRGDGCWQVCAGLKSSTAPAASLTGVLRWRCNNNCNARDPTKRDNSRSSSDAHAAADGEDGDEEEEEEEKGLHHATLGTHPHSLRIVASPSPIAPSVPLSIHTERPANVKQSAIASNRRRHCGSPFAFRVHSAPVPSFYECKAWLCVPKLRIDA